MAVCLVGIHETYRGLWEVFPLVFVQEPAKRRTCTWNEFRTNFE
jgi:hypothetical protein